VQFLTDFADQKLTLPLSLIVACAFALSGWKRGALAWIGVVAGVLAIMAVLKIVFVSCGWRWAGGAMQSPSGHTATAALLYGGFALIFIRPHGRLRHALPLIPISVAVIFGLSRLALHLHSVAEVLGGGLIGTAGALLLPRLAGPPPPHITLRHVLVPAALVIVLLHGKRLQAEEVIRHFAIEGLWPPASCIRPAQTP
jgi:membrane-associated phospholipid phosphatase